MIKINSTFKKTVIYTIPALFILVSFSRSKHLKRLIFQKRDEQPTEITNKIYSYEERIKRLKEDIQLDPQNVELKFTLARLYNILGRCQEAVDQYFTILQLEPNNYKAMYKAGYSFQVKGDIQKAVKQYNDVLKQIPSCKPILYMKSLAYLYDGDFTNGWRQYTAWLKKEKRYAENLHTWIKNNELQGKRILLTPEGGLGDTIQFIRYAEELKKRGAHVTVLAQKPLKHLLSRCTYIDELLVDKKNINKHYDAIASIMSLPALFESDEKAIPKNIPYIYPDKKLVKQWNNTFANKKTFNVGICWKADSRGDKSRLLVGHRSIPIKQLEPLSSLENVAFYSLLKEDRTNDLKDLPPHFVVNTFGPDYDSKNGAFMDSAAIIPQFDLVITVDTSVAHLAGALGAPVFLILPYDCSWRWILHRADSPWYPNMKIFKQPAPFDWQSVVEMVKTALRRTL